MNNRPKPKLGSHYQILAVKNPSDSHLVGKGVTILSWDASRYPAPWGILAGVLDDSSRVTGLACAIHRDPITCTCNAYPFPHRPGGKCHAKG